MVDDEIFGYIPRPGASVALVDFLIFDRVAFSPNKTHKTAKLAITTTESTSTSLATKLPQLAAE